MSKHIYQKISFYSPGGFLLKPSSIKRTTEFRDKTIEGIQITCKRREKNKTKKAASVYKLSDPEDDSLQLKFLGIEENSKTMILKMKFCE